MGGQCEDGALRTLPGQDRTFSCARPFLVPSPLRLPPSLPKAALPLGARGSQRGFLITAGEALGEEAGAH